MDSAAVDVYVEAFLARCVAMRHPGQAMVDEPVIYGLLPGTGDGHTRLLVTDDGAHDVLSAVVPDARAGMITVCAPHRSARRSSTTILHGRETRRRR